MLYVSEFSVERMEKGDGSYYIDIVKTNVSDEDESDALMSFALKKSDAEHILNQAKKHQNSDGNYTLEVYDGEDLASTIITDSEGVKEITSKYIKFETVEWEGKVIYLSQNAYYNVCHNVLGDCYQASGVDLDGNHYSVEWEITDHEGPEEYDAVDDWEKPWDVVKI